jgi:ribulose 1,5-bisphosphate synthetase/thiazole synthase
LLQQCLDERAPREHREECVALWIDATGHDTFVTESLMSRRHAAGLDMDTPHGDAMDVERTLSSTSPDAGDRKLTVDSMAA